MRKQTNIEETLNGITHGIGALLSVSGLKILLGKALIFGGLWRIASCGIYGASLILLYLASALYHFVPMSRGKDVLRVFDHSLIYLLIAGTYTPFCLITLRGWTGWTMFGLMWGCACAGLLLKLVYGKISSGLYIFMGWLAVIAIKPLINALSLNGFMWMLAGGLFYTVGVIFYSLENVKFMHVVWHFFVIAGSVCHFLVIFFYVLS